jgi:hypothetical protein
MRENSRYYQSIARRFFMERGAPFFLSSREQDLIAKWEKMEIPLFIVLEGMKSAFSSYRRKSGRKAKIQSLGFCDFQILKAFEQARERKVGQKRKGVERDEKRIRAKAEVNRFLEAIPFSVGYLKGIFSRAKKILSQTRLDEEELERIEEDIEELLFMNTPDEEKEKIKGEVLAEFEFKEKEECSRIFKIKVVKFLREKYKIPYISLYYY